MQTVSPTTIIYCVVHLRTLHCTALLCSPSITVHMHLEHLLIRFGGSSDCCDHIVDAQLGLVVARTTSSVRWTLETLGLLTSCHVMSGACTSAKRTTCFLFTQKVGSSGSMNRVEHGSMGLSRVRLTLHPASSFEFELRGVTPTTT